MTWSATFQSPEGEAIYNFEVAGAVIGDKAEYEHDIEVALDAADSLTPNSEDGTQRVSLSGWHAETAEGRSRSFSVVVTELVVTPVKT